MSFHIRYFSRQSPIDQAFGILRELYQTNGPDTPIDVSVAVQRCARKGITEEVLKKSIETYTANGIIMLDRQNRILFTMN